MATILQDTRETRTEDTLNLPMPKRRLGVLPWEASLFTLGGVKWDTQLDDAGAAAVIHRALELGVNTFDTAHGYGGGESERKLGLALEGRREKVWINTKTGDRSYDGAMRQMETSLKRLRTDYVDLMFVHSLDNQEQYEQVMGPNSVLKALEEMQAAGHVRYVGVSGHWVKHVMARILGEYPWNAVLFPVGLFNIAYNYSFLDEVLPIARKHEIAVLGMKVLAAGRAKHARSVAPYIRYSCNLPIDTAVMGADSVAQVEENVRIVKGALEPLTDAEVQDLLPEARAVTQNFDPGEFSWVSHYRQNG